MIRSALYVIRWKSAHVFKCIPPNSNSRSVSDSNNHAASQHSKNNFRNLYLLKTSSGAKKPCFPAGIFATDVLQCKTGEDSYLFGLSGNDRFISFDNNTHSCVMVGGLYGTKTYVLQPSGGSAASGSALTIKGYKGDDLLDFLH